MLEVRGEIAFQFRLRVAAQGRVARVHGQVLQIVQVAEHGNATELADPGQERETQVAVGALDGLQGVALGHALMDADEIMKRAEGFAVDVSRVFMQPGTYEKGWTTSEE